MSVDRPTKRVHRRAATELLGLLGEMEAPGFKFYQPHDAEAQPAGGAHLPGVPVYHPAAGRLWNLLYDSSLFIDPYAPLPEDPTQDGVAFSVMGTSFPPDYFTSATIDQVRRYLVLCTRGERFCDGHMAAEWDSGAFLAAMRRFRELCPRRK